MNPGASTCKPTSPMGPQSTPQKQISNNANGQEVALSVADGHASLSREEFTDEKLSLIHGVMLEELCALRRDVDSIGNGGWNVKVGPFQHAEKRAAQSTDAFKARILEKLGVAVADPPLALLVMAPHADSASGVAQKPDNSSLLSKLKDSRAAVVKPNGTSSTKTDASESGVQTELASRPRPSAVDLRTVRADTPMQSIEDPARNAGEAWQPNYLRGLASLQDLKIPPPSKVVTFTGEFLQSTFGGIEWSPGLYFKPVSAGDCLLPTRTYYAINATCEPYLPTKSGTHGAKLVPFFNNVDTTDGDAAYENVPLFISAAKRGNNRFGDNEYIYFGTYSQTRWSDKLDYDRIREHVPDEVKFFWAEQLSDPGRPDWVTRCLMKHMIPQPEYEGVLPNSSAASDVTVDEKDLNKQMDKDVRRYIRELRAWEKDASLKAKLLKKENILVAFGNADADADPGLRLWWEYLECVGFDNGFYDMLVGLQAKQKR